MKKYEIYVEKHYLGDKETREIICAVDEFSIACEKYVCQAVKERGYDDLEIDFVVVGLYDRVLEKLIIFEIC